MALKTISVVLTGNATSLRGALIASAREVDAFSNKVDGMGAKTSNVGAKIAAGFAVAGAAVAAGLTVAVASAAQFEARMRNVNSISALSEEAFAGLSSKVLDLSRELPQSANNLAEGLYEIASSGFQGAEGLEVLEKAAQAASAGLTTTQTSAKAIVGVLNAYGMAASEAGRVSDVLFQTVNLGVISFEELSQNLGDVIGLAAAAGVTIEEVGAAIAAITLAGVPAAEAFTGLNTLTKSLIKPSEELSTVYRALGINITRDLKDPAIGLRGVMEQLRVATGGNVEAFIALFPEIRAARAAFALAANEGENYARTSAGITDKTQTAGATMRAFNEQMKAVSNQFKVFVNGLQAGAIELGTHLLPLLSDALRGLQALGRDAMPALSAGMAALQPFFTALVQIGGDIITIAGDMVAALGPAARAIAGLVAAGVITALNGLAETLSAITGFLADHSEVMTAVGVAYAGFLAATAISAGLAALPAMLAAVEVGAAKAALGVGNLAASLTTLKGAATGVGLLAAVLGITATLNGIANAKRQADDLADSLAKGLDFTKRGDLDEYLQRISAQRDDLRETTNEGDRFTRFLKTVYQFATPAKNSLADAAEAYKRLGLSLEEVNRMSVSYDENVNTVSNKTGLSTKAVGDLAKVLGVDLTQSYGKSKEAREKLITHYDDLIKAAHGGGEAAKAGAQLSIEALQEQAAAASELAKKVTEAFQGATDIVKGFSADVAKEKGLKGFLEENLKSAESFAQGIQDAARRGLDPAIISKLLQAGPEAAAPFLQAIAADHSGNLIKLANDTERALGEINTKVVAFARLTQQAINSVDDKKVTQLGDAMRITAEVFDREGAKTAEAIATKLGIPLARVTEVAKEYGITLGNTAAPAATAKEAAEAFGAALAGLAPKLVENGRSLDVSTTAGKANRDAIQEVIDKAYAHVDSLKAQGATMDQQRSAFNRHMEDLRATLEQAGYTKGEIDALIGSLKGIEGTYRANIEIDSSAANATLDQLQGRLNSLNAEIVSSGPGGGRGAERAAVEERIENYDDSGTGFEKDGGVLRFYGRGGMENHVAQIAKANTVRVWAEPETGGEAYIPLSPSKRGRSTDILAAVADEFGYALTRRFANGGISEDDPNWDWRTMGNQQRGVQINGHWYIEHADGRITNTHPNDPGAPPLGSPSPAAQMQVGLGGSAPAYSPPRYSGSGSSYPSSGGGGCNFDYRAFGDAVVRAFVDAGVTMSADGRQIGQLVAKRLHAMRRP